MSFREDSKAQLALLDLAPDAIFARDASRRITYWSSGAHATYGWSAKQALGRVAGELLRTEYPVPLEEIERIVAESGHWEGDLVQHTSDGERLIVESRWAAQYDADGSLSWLLEVNRDITARLTAQAEHERLKAEAERERLVNRLNEATRLESLGELAGGIAHDFNNLLSVIINYAGFVSSDVQAAAESDPGWSSTLDDIEQIRRASERAAHLTRQLLAFARRDEVRAETIDVNEIVRDVEQLLKRTLGEHVELESRLGHDLLPVKFNPGQLEQILVNLAVNARDAMPDGGRLEIDTANVEVDELYAASRPELSPGRYVRVRVSDTGSGMPEEVCRRAFDPFFTTKPPGQGTGLGLATVYGIVKQAGGRAQIYSEHGIGTTFTALLPTTGRRAKSRTPERRPARRSCAATILLVEDEPALRDVTRRILESHGYKVLVACNGAEALAVAHEREGDAIDLLLTDVVMPQMPGPQLAQELRSARPKTRVLFMSGFAEPVLAAQGHLQASALIDKPFSAAGLLAKVSDALTPARGWRGPAPEQQRDRPGQPSPKQQPVHTGRPGSRRDERERTAWPSF
jgi:PAS domain S-box-containing protein